MLYIVLGFTCFVSAALGHILFCRWAKIKTLWLRSFWCFISLFFILYIVFAETLIKSTPQSSPDLWTLPLNATTMAIYILFTPVYIMIYFGAFEDSPSKIILDKLRRDGIASYEELNRLLTNEHFIYSRLRDLETCGFIHVKDNQYKLLPRGHRVARILDLCQKICNRELGG